MKYILLYECQHCCNGISRKCTLEVETDEIPSSSAEDIAREDEFLANQCHAQGTSKWELLSITEA